MLIFLFNLTFLIPLSLCLDTSDIVIVILSQQEGYHAAHAKLLKDTIIDESKSHDQEPPEIILTHEDAFNGSWTLYPLIPKLAKKYPNANWFFFCLDNTAIRLQTLIKVLYTFDASNKLWIGHALYDEEPTIIHHFADHTKKFKYPNVASGFAITKPLMQNINKRHETEGFPKIDFSIDASYEFATYIYNNGKGSRLTHLPEFCIFASQDCATYPKAFYPCTDIVRQDKIYVAVKTYDKNHDDRYPFLIKTWLKFIKNFGLYSNVEDNRLPNVIVVPNTTEGHCAKTQAILEHANKIIKSQKIDWLVIVDDDTIISMARLARLLTCYNPEHPVALGERYGFRVVQNTGYEYLTGGAGLALSVTLVERMVQAPVCKCPSATMPDDMFLFGACLNRIGVQLTHSPLFHQARPSDYARSYLASQEPVSFHKYWMIDPVAVYDQWFSEADVIYKPDLKHTEL